MTHITVKKTENRYILHVEGHAGYAEYGKDIVCAAVSILTYTWINELELLKENGSVENVVFQEEDGKIKVGFEIDKNKSEDEQKAVLTAFETILTGFCTLEKNFSDYVCFKGEI